MRMPGFREATPRCWRWFCSGSRRRSWPLRGHRRHTGIRHGKARMSGPKCRRCTRCLHRGHCLCRDPGSPTFGHWAWIGSRNRTQTKLKTSLDLHGWAAGSAAPRHRNWQQGMLRYHWERSCDLGRLCRLGDWEELVVVVEINRMLSNHLLSHLLFLRSCGTSKWQHKETTWECKQRPC